MKYSDLKAWHANVIMAIILLITWIAEKNGVFFTLACCFIALAFAGKIREDQKALAASQVEEAKKEAAITEEILSADEENTEETARSIALEEKASQDGQE